MSSTPDERVAPPSTSLRSAWDAPLWAHAILLGILLLIGIPLVGSGSSFSADEGPAVLQAEAVARGDGWVFELPVPEADPRGERIPLELSSTTEDGFVPFAKHPTYVVALAAAGRLGGPAGMVTLSVLAVVAAALASAALASRLDPRWSRPTLWLVGVGSPLVFDAYLVQAHALGAALAGGAALAALEALQRRRLPWLAAASAAVVLGGLVRRESVLFGLALAVAFAVAAWRDRRPGWALGGAGALAGATVVGYVLSVYVSALAIGTEVAAGSAPSSRSGFVAGRVQAFLVTWLSPGSGSTPVGDVLVLVAVVSAVVAAVYLRVDPTRAEVISRLFVVSAVALVVRLALPTGVISGLVFAFPLLVPGLVLLRRELFRRPAAVLCGVSAALFALGVLATQYSKGGGGEWGGRFFAVGIPVAAPLVVAAVGGAVAALDRRHRHVVIAALAVGSIAVGGLGLRTLGAQHEYGDRLAGWLRAVSEEGADPVVVATTPLPPRIAWPVYDEVTWLLQREPSEEDEDDEADEAARAEYLADLDEVLTALAAADRTEVVLVTSDLEEDEEAVLAEHGEIVEVTGLPPRDSLWAVRVTLS